MPPRRHSLSLIGLMVLVACGRGEPESEPEGQAQRPDRAPSEPLSVYTVNYPLQYFAERIGGELVEVTFPVPAAVDPAYWTPDPEEIAEYQKADLILVNGLGYAKWLERASLPASKLIDTSASLGDRRIELTEGAVHTHGPEGEHSHKGYAFTSWLSPQLAIEQAQAIALAFAAAMPEERARVEENLSSLRADLEDLDGRLTAVRAKIGDQPLLFSHPVYQYLEAQYELAGRSLHWEPDEPPSEDQWRELAVVLKEHPARWMIWEQEPLAETADRLAGLGILSVVFDPCANRPINGDLLSVMDGNAANLALIQPRE